MIVPKEKITSLIPHRGEFVVIDNLLEIDDKFATTDFTVNDNNMFTEGDVFSEAGIIENIGQTAAAGAGYFYRVYDKEPPLAFFAVFDSVKIYRYPRRHEYLTTRTEVVMKMLNISVISGVSYCDGKMIAECRMKIVTQTE